MITGPDYLLVGHITRDLLDDGTTVAGGTSFYAAITAHRLGKAVAVISASAELPSYWPQAINMGLVSPNSPTFANKYTGHPRQQSVFTTGDPITLADISRQWRSARIVHLSPVLGETPEALVHAFPRALVGVTPQGWMRSLAPKLPSPVAYSRWDPSPQVLNRIDALILSIEDVEGDESRARAYARHCGLVALTRGAHGATLFVKSEPYHVAAFPAQEEDPTGAGDVFAAALLIRLYETDNPFEAARFASGAAALSVEAPGAVRVPTRAELDVFLKQSC